MKNNGFGSALKYFRCVTAQGTVYYRSTQAGAERLQERLGGTIEALKNPIKEDA